MTSRRWARWGKLLDNGPAKPDVALEAAQASLEVALSRTGEIEKLVERSDEIYRKNGFVEMMNMHMQRGSKRE